MNWQRWCARSLTAALTLVLGCGIASAQEQPDVERQTSGAGQTHLGAESPRLATQADVAGERNVLSGSVFTGVMLDTSRAEYNGSQSSRAVDVRFTVVPSVVLQQQRRTVQWAISYTTGGTTHSGDWNQFEYQNIAAGDLLWMPSYRTRVHLRQDYRLLTNPFDEVAAPAGLADTGGAMGPVYQGLLPSTRRTMMSSLAEVTYRLSRHSSVGVTGGYEQQDYEPLDGQVVSPVVITNTRTVSASAFYSRQISPRHTVGAQYMFFDIYSGTFDRTQTHGATIFDQIRLARNAGLTVFAGAEYGDTRMLVPLDFGVVTLYSLMRSQSWSPMGGAILSWQTKRHAFVGEYVHRITSGGALLTAVKANAASIGWRSNASPRWTLDAHVQLSDQRAVYFVTQRQHLQSVWLGAGAQYKLARNVSVRADYGHSLQTQAAFGTLGGNADFFQIGVIVAFSTPLGR